MLPNTTGRASFPKSNSLMLSTLLLFTRLLAIICWLFVFSPSAFADNLRGGDSDTNGSLGQANAPVRLRPSEQFRPSVQGLAPLDKGFSEILGIYSLTSLEGAAANLIIDSAGTIGLFLPKSGTTLEFAKINRKLSISPALSADNRLLAVAEGRYVHIYSLETLRQLYLLKRLKANINSMDFSPDGESILLAGADGKVYRWRFVFESTATKEQEIDKALERYIGHSSIVAAVKYHPLGRLFFSGDWRGGLSAWQPFDADKFAGAYDNRIFTGESLTEDVIRMKGSREAGAAVDRLAVDAQGEMLYLAVQDGTIEAWQVRGFKKIGSTRASTGIFYDLILNQAGDKLAVVGRDGKISEFKIEKKRVDENRKAEITFIKDAESLVPGARRLKYINDTSVVAGTKTGEVKVTELEALKE